jgi:tRNA (cmo5U34)-methyltransferase
VDRGVIMPGDRWDFDILAPDYDRHSVRSIPDLEASRIAIARCAPAFLRTGARVYELGSATGRLAAHVLAAQPDTRFEYIGIDASPRMSARAGHRLHRDPRFTARTGPIQTLRFKPAELVLAHYTLHFLGPETRHALLRRIHDSLRPGGALVLYEKVLDPDPARQDAITAGHVQYKRAAGFELHQIRNKRRLLEGVLQPWTRIENERALRAAGFTDVTRLPQRLGFEGYLARRAPIEETGTPHRP